LISGPIGVRREEEQHRFAHVEPMIRNQETEENGQGRHRTVRHNRNPTHWILCVGDWFMI
jgi:hypothetical protein